MASLEDLCTLSGPARSVSSLEYSPNGHLLAAASSDGSLYVYEGAGADADAGGSSSPSGILKDCPLRLQGHARGVSDVTWSPDSRFLASASDDLTIAIWCLEPGARRMTQTDAIKARATLKGHTNYVFCLSWGPTGGVLASGSFDESVRLWDAHQPGTCLRTMQAHADPVTGVSFSPDGTLLASSSYDGLIRLWDVRSGRCVKTIVDDDNPPVSSIRFSLNGKYLLAATLDDTVRLWSVHSGKCVKSYGGHVNRKYCIPPAFIVEPGGRLGASAGADANTDAETVAGKRTKNSDAEDGGEGAVTPPPSVRIAMGSEDGNLLMWDLNGRDILLKRNIFPRSTLLALAINPIRPELAMAALRVTDEADGGAGEGNKIKVCSFK